MKKQQVRIDLDPGIKDARRRVRNQDGREALASYFHEHERAKLPTAWAVLLSDEGIRQ
jgi:hypothetical protein